jgi:hypothetical protein
MDIGVWMRSDVLAHKLEAVHEKNTEQAWNLSRWPSRITEKAEHRLFVASSGYWRGYFKLGRDALFNPADKVAPYTLLFDTRSWTPIPKIPVSQFRGFTYHVPRLMQDGSVLPPDATPVMSDGIS